MCGYVGLKRGRARKRCGVGGSLEIRQSLFTMGPEWSEGSHLALMATTSSEGFFCILRSETTILVVKL
jgi:hypothetical protein